MPIIGHLDRKMIEKKSLLSFTTHLFIAKRFDTFVTRLVGNKLGLLKKVLENLLFPSGHEGLQTSEA